MTPDRGCVLGTLIRITLVLIGPLCFGQAQFFSSNVSPVIGPTYTSKTCVAFGAPPQTCTWSAAPSIGETIHCGGQGSGSGGNVTAFNVTDNASTPNTYTANGAIVGPATSSSWYIGLQDSFNITHSPTTTTAVLVGTASSIVFQCITTTGTSGAAIDGARASATATGTSNSVTITPVTVNDFGYCVSQSGGATTWGATTWTPVPANLNTAYKNGLAAGSQSTVLTSTNSLTLVSVCGTYK